VLTRNKHSETETNTRKTIATFLFLSVQDNSFHNP
jgi:hypothetical protein